MKKILLINIVFISSIIHLFAQDNANDCSFCNVALKQDIISYEFDDSSFLSYLYTLDESNYKSIQQNGGINFGIPDWGIEIFSSANWEDFKKQREEKRKSLNVTISKETSIRLLSEKVSKEGYDSYNNCLNACLGKNGLYLYIIESSDEQIILRLKYLTSPGVDYPLIINNLQLTNCRFIDEKYSIKHGDSIKPGSEMSYILYRDGNKVVYGVLNGTVNGVAYTSKFKINKYYDPDIPFKQLVTLSENERCDTSICKNYNNIESVEIVEITIPKGATTDVTTELVLTNETLKHHWLSFGHWENEDCSKVMKTTIYGNGWHYKVGSCGQNALGTHDVKVSQVKAIVKFKKNTLGFHKYLMNFNELNH